MSTSNFNFNLRGLLIAPENKPEISYYLCLMDVPAGLSQSDFIPLTTSNTQVIDPEASIKVCLYECSKDLSSYVGQKATQTIALPMYTNNPTEAKKTILIIDTAGNTVSGDPNRGIPPKIKLDADPGPDFKTTNTVIQSATANPNLTSCYFVVVITSSKSQSSPDVLNYFKSMVKEENKTLKCQLEVSTNQTKIVAPVGVYGTEKDGITHTKVDEGADATTVDWSTDKIYHL